MSGRGKRDHWSTKDDPFSISEPPRRRSPSPEQREPSTGLLINFDDDDNGASGGGYMPASPTAPSAPPIMETDIDEPRSRQHFQEQRASNFPPLKDPEIGRHRNYHETEVLSKYHASSTHASGNTGQQQSSTAWSSGNGGPLSKPSNYKLALTGNTHQGGLPPRSIYSGGTGFSAHSTTGTGLHRKLGTRTSNIYPSDEEEATQPSSTGMKPSTSSGSGSQQKLSIVKSMDEINDFGKWELLAKDSMMHKMIAIYVNNSIELPTSDGHVQIHQICQLTSGWSLSWSHSNKMLLWYKTTPGGIKYLARKSDGCIAFYDRIARAFPVKPTDLKQPLRQIILLCTVALGTCKGSLQGYKDWSDKGVPRGSHSVKGVGRLEPDSKENRKRVSKLQGDTIIPCGKTVSNTEYEKYALEYSEYLVFEANQIKVEYAVDVEIIPK